MARSNLAPRLTSFVGRDKELETVTALVGANRLVTLAGAGGCGKSRLAVEAGRAVLDDFSEGVWFVDLSSLVEPGRVLVTVMHTLAMHDAPGPPKDRLEAHIAEWSALVVLDNCEHLLDEVADTIATLTVAPGVMVLTTSREPVGVDGEVVVRVPSLSRAASVSLFCDLARRVRQDFDPAAEGGVAIVEEICDRLDGMPLAIELAAARTRVLSVAQVRDQLNDRFRLLTGGSRGRVRRQQTLRASMDWSHGLLSAADQALFRRLAVFSGAFDADAAEAVGAGEALAREGVFDGVTSLVDKSLLVAERRSGTVRYRLLETMRQYALERLSDAGEADAVRRRHRDHYFACAAAAFESPLHVTLKEELDNMRAALRWTISSEDAETAVLFAPLLFPSWYPDHVDEGRQWLDEVLELGRDLPGRARGFSLAASAFFEALMLGPMAVARAEEAVAIARDDLSRRGERLLPFAMVSLALARYHESGGDAGNLTELADLALEAAAIARRSGDGALSIAHLIAGFLLTVVDPGRARPLLEEARAASVATGNDHGERLAAGLLAETHLYMGELRPALELADAQRVSAEEAGDESGAAYAKVVGAWARALLGDHSTAHRLADEALAYRGLISSLVSYAHSAHGLAWLAQGDAEAAVAAFGIAAVPHGVDFAGPPAFFILSGLVAEAQLTLGRIDDARARTAADLQRRGWRDVKFRHAGVQLAAARVALVDGSLERAESLAHEALATRFEIGDKLGTVDALELIAAIEAAGGDGDRAARLFGAADGARAAHELPRLAVFASRFDGDVECARAVAGTAEAFAAGWTQGASMTLEEAVDYARRGRGKRGRPRSGWASLTPTEEEVVRLVSAGLDNPAIAERLFVSTRTVNSHLTRIYRKVAVKTRVQLAQEAARRLPSA